jgi:hypothetical protein
VHALKQKSYDCDAYCKSVHPDNVGKCSVDTNGLGYCNCTRFYKLTIRTQADITGLILPIVQFIVDEFSQTTNSSGIKELMLTPGQHTITATNVNTRFFSHFWDHDCDDTDEGWYLDTTGSPFGRYTFEIFDREKEITAFYKTLTKITDFGYNCTSISGKLLDENNNALTPGPKNYHPVCEDPSGVHSVVVDKNIMLEYSTDNGLSWNYINTVTASSDGSWSYSWNHVSGTNRVRARYNPTNWYYNWTSVEIPVSCIGTLDVYSNQANTKVAIGLGDADWNGVVDDNDLNICTQSLSSSPGQPKWDIDCDMNLDNKIDAKDISLITLNTGKTIPIYTTHFTVNLDTGAYDIRAKYDNQIKNLNLVINKDQTTRVDFSFLPCDGFVALNCNVPSLAHPEDIRLWGDNNCGRSNAKIDCDGNYNKHSVCDPNTCTLIEPTMRSYSVSKTSLIPGESFSINFNGNCPAVLPGKCLIECRVIHPDGHYIEIDTWDEDGSATLPVVTCDQEGNYVVDYCAVATDFYANRGWSVLDHSDTTVSCATPTTTSTTSTSTTTTTSTTSIITTSTTTTTTTSSTTTTTVPNCDQYDGGYQDTYNTIPKSQCSGYDYSKYTTAYQIRDYYFDGIDCDCSVTYDSYLTSTCIKGRCNGDVNVKKNEYINVTISVKNTGSYGQGWWFVGVEFWNASDYNSPMIRDKAISAYYNGKDKVSGCYIGNCGCTYSDPDNNGILEGGETINVSCWMPASYWPITTGNERIMLWIHERDMGQDSGTDGCSGDIAPDHCGTAAGECVYGGIPGCFGGTWWNDALSRVEPAAIRVNIQSATCGNSVCDAGEDCVNCPGDCTCPTGKKCCPDGSCVLSSLPCPV